MKTKSLFILPIKTSSLKLHRAPLKSLEIFFFNLEHFRFLFIFLNVLVCQWIFHLMGFLNVLSEFN